MTSNTTVIPVIRLDDPDQQTMVKILRDACVDVGFFYLEGHGIETELMDAVHEQSEIFFKLSTDSKKILSDPVLNRGYTGMQEQSLDPKNQTKGNTKEGFNIGEHITIENPAYSVEKLRGPNQWPTPERTPDMDDTDKFRHVMETYYDRLLKVSHKLVKLIALAIGLEESALDPYFAGTPFATLRLLHYAAVPSNPSEGEMTVGAQRDWGFIRLLNTYDYPGLQIFTKDEVWIDVPPRKGAFVVNLGDMLERWTNDLFRSTKHRVLTAGQTERYSTPFFLEPNFDVSVCGPGVWKDSSTLKLICYAIRQSLSVSQFVVLLRIPLNTLLLLQGNIWSTNTLKPTQISNHTDIFVESIVFNGPRFDFEKKCIRLSIPQFHAACTLIV